MMDFRRVCVGIITKPVGIKGQVKLHPYTTSPDFFLQHTRLFLNNGIEIVLQCPRIDQSGDVIVCIENIKNRTEADGFRLQEVFVPREELPQLGEDEYYYEDLVGLHVVDDKHEQLGKVNAIHDYGAGTFLEISLPDMKTATISFNRETIIDVDFQVCEVVVNKRFLLL